MFLERLKFLTQNSKHMTSEQFKQHEALLQKIGNFRTPYLVLVTPAGEQTEAYAKTAALSASCKHIHANDSTFDDLSWLNDCQHLQLCIVHATAIDNVPLILFNELIISQEDERQILSNTMSAEYTNCFRKHSNCCIRTNIPIWQLRAMSSNKICLVQGIKAAPYETLYLVLDAGVCFTAIWDTRKITAVSDELLEYDFSTHHDVNDNSRLFYIERSMLNKLSDKCKTAIAPFIADIIED